MTENYELYKASRSEKTRWILIFGALWVVIGYLFYSSLTGMIILSFLTIPTYKGYLKYKAEKQRQELGDQFRDLLYSLSASFSAGRQMKEALIESVENMKLIHGERGLITRELIDMERKMEQTGQSEEVVLWDFARRSKNRDIINFVDVCSICKKTGGDLINVVQKAGNVLASQIEIRREVRKLTAQKRYEATIIALTPIVMLIFLRVSSPGYLDIMYQSLAGRILMTFALGVMTGAYLLSLRLCKVEL